MSTRIQLLAAARELYLRDGLAGLSMRAVAERVGVSAPAIYRHFEGKEDLVFELCREGHRIFASYLARALVEPTAYARLIASGLAYFDFAVEHRGYYALLFVTPASELGFEKLGPRNLEEGQVTFRMLVDRVRECLDEGVLAAADPNVTALEIWGHVHGLSSIYLRSCDGLSMPEPLREPAAFRGVYERSLHHLLNGLAPR